MSAEVNQFLGLIRLQHEHAHQKVCAVCGANPPEAVVLVRGRYIGVCRACLAAFPDDGALSRVMERE